MDCDFAIDMANNNVECEEKLKEPSSSQRRKRSAPQRIKLHETLESAVKMETSNGEEEGCKLKVDVSDTLGHHSSSGGRSDSNSSAVSFAISAVCNSGSLPEESIEDNSLSDKQHLLNHLVGMPAPLVKQKISPKIKREKNEKIQPTRIVPKPETVSAATASTNNSPDSDYSSNLLTAVTLNGLNGLNNDSQNTLGNLNVNNVLMLLLQQNPQLAAAALNIPFGGGLSSAENSMGSSLINGIRSLPAPTPNLPSYAILLQQYLNILNQYQNLMQQISQYAVGYQQAKVAAAAQEACTNNVSSSGSLDPPISSTHAKKEERITISHSTSLNGASSRNGAGLVTSWSGMDKKEGRRSVSGVAKKANFRGTSELENRVDPCFKDYVTDEGRVQLSRDYPNVTVPRDIYDSLVAKATGSATRLIRLLMKHFFSQKELARSSLSGEGQYKHRLNPDITLSIKAFIRRRHPSLRSGTINLCMTDVCVQARRVSHNQLQRMGRTRTIPKDSATSANLSLPHLTSSAVNECDASVDAVENGGDFTSTPSPTQVVGSPGQQSFSH